VPLDEFKDVKPNPRGAEQAMVWLHAVARRLVAVEGIAGKVAASVEPEAYFTVPVPLPADQVYVITVPVTSPLPVKINVNGGGSTPVAALGKGTLSTSTELRLGAWMTVTVAVLLSVPSTPPLQATFAPAGRVSTYTIALKVPFAKAVEGMLLSVPTGTAMTVGLVDAGVMGVKLP
jgi:hypothetical protein